jgi:hypothetical protein
VRQEGDVSDEGGGDAACWLPRVCDHCGQVVERPEDHRCADHPRPASTTRPGRRAPSSVPGVARIPLVDPDDAHLDPSVREILQGVTGSALGVPNVLRAMANHPGALRDGAQVAYRPGSLITPAQRELAYLTASVANRCHY